LQGSKILYTFVLRAEIATIFGPNVVAISTHNTKVYKICKAIYFPHFTTFRNQFILVHALSSCGDLFASPCLVLKLVYNGNCVLKTENDNSIPHIRYAEDTLSSFQQS
jgi:hypothetical protein